MKGLALLFLLMFVVACGGDGVGDADGEGDQGIHDGDGETDSDADSDGNVGDGEAGDGEGGDGEIGDGDGGDGDGGTCEPIEVCEVECGSVDDGCGGILDCGVCGCIEGQAQVTACGVCDLGTLVCGASETGPGQCEELEIPGATSCDDLVFVDLREGSDLGQGTKEEPVASLADGLSVARSSNAVAVLLAGSDTVTYDGPVLLDRRISIVGGYDSDWRRNSQRPTILSETGVDWLEEGDIVGIAVIGFGQSLLLSNLVVQTEEAGEGGTNYGILVHEAPGLKIENVEVLAGRGGDGKRGNNGEDGLRGPDGEDAPEEIVAPLTGAANAVYLAMDDAAGGINIECQEANGGLGGRGGAPFSPPATTGGASASGQALGGNAGVSGGDRFGGDGDNGPVITTLAERGLGGRSIGSIVEGRWIVGGNGQPGSNGLHGSGGGGGGGGASGSVGGGYTIGSFGGGGGAGGCGGLGGEGGGGGGGSFGLFVVSSDIVIERSRFFADLGGRGGDGGFGGIGGSGGSGGIATVRFVPEGTSSSTIVYENVNAQGGTGGNGARGEDGGAGGGGAGGVSYGAYCVNSELSTIGTVRFSGGGSAVGGSSAGLAGEIGASSDMFQCN